MLYHNCIKLDFCCIRFSWNVEEGWSNYSHLKELLPKKSSVSRVKRLIWCRLYLKYFWYNKLTCLFCKWNPFFAVTLIRKAFNFDWWGIPLISVSVLSQGLFLETWIIVEHIKCNWTFSRQPWSYDFDHLLGFNAWLIY